MSFLYGLQHISTWYILLKGFAMLGPVVEALRGLPAWSGTLDLRDCGPWPLEPTQYKGLAHAIPTSYTVWELGHSVPQAVVDSICEGVNERRERLGLRPIAVCWSAHEGPARKVGEHVMVMRWRSGWPRPDIQAFLPALRAALSARFGIECLC